MSHPIYRDTLGTLAETCKSEGFNNWRKEKADAAELLIPSVGKTICVKSKRSKVPHGTEGVVFFFGISKYWREPSAGKWDRSARLAGMFCTGNEKIVDRIEVGAYRVGFKASDGTKHFCSAQCVEIIQSN